MKIISIRPAPPSGSAVARFDVELHGGLRLHDIALKTAADGTFRAPRRARSGSPSFATSLRSTMRPTRS